MIDVFACWHIYIYTYYLDGTQQSIATWRCGRCNWHCSQTWTVIWFLLVSKGCDMSCQHLMNWPWQSSTLQKTNIDMGDIDSYVVPENMIYQRYCHIYVDFMRAKRFLQFRWFSLWFRVSHMYGFKEFSWSHGSWSCVQVLSLSNLAWVDKQVFKVSRPSKDDNKHQLYYIYSCHVRCWICWMWWNSAGCWLEHEGKKWLSNQFWEWNNHPNRGSFFFTNQNFPVIQSS